MSRHTSSSMAPPQSSRSVRNPVTVVDWSKNPTEMYHKVVAFLRLKVKDAQSTGEKLCAVFDVDDTLICDSPDEADTWARHTLGWHLYNYCNAHGIHIRIVTARAASRLSVKYLMNQLRKSGFCNPPDETQNGLVTLLGDPRYRGARPVEVYMEPGEFANSGHPNSHGQAKRAVRDALSRRGERVVLCVGDQITDHVESSPKLYHYLSRRFQPTTYYAFCNPRFPGNLCIKTPEIYRGWPSASRGSDGSGSGSNSSSVPAEEE
jgi:hypothetical protein